MSARSPGGVDEVEYETIRAHLARTETPTALLVIGALVGLLSFVNFLMHPAYFPAFHAMDAAAAVTLVGAGLVLRGRTARPNLTRWVFAACMVLLVVNLEIQVWQDRAISPGYVLILMCMFGPLVLGWSPFVSGAAVMTFGLGIATAPRSMDAVIDVVFLAVCAAMASAVLLQVRMKSIHNQAAAVVRANEMATVDPLTGTLNRRGLEGMLPGFAATARRLGQSITVYFVDVDGLKAANDTSGHAFGDEVLQAVARAIRGTVRQGDLVARWGGDEFVVVGMGGEGADGEFTERLRRRIRSDGADLERWRGTVSVGLASGDLESIAIGELVDRADMDMYDRRRASRQE